MARVAPRVAGGVVVAVVVAAGGAEVAAEGLEVVRAAAQATERPAVATKVDQPVAVKSRARLAAAAETLPS